MREEGLRVKSNGGYREVAIEVSPVKGSGAKEGGFLVLFEESSQANGSASATSQEMRREGSPGDRSPCSPDADNARLAQELAATREYLQSLIEQQEAANEELQSANEEVQSANEELQSTNEELETSKEEIQSSNEELATVNDELNNRNAELNRVNNDLVNLLGSVQMAIVMLGPDLCVRRFTPMRRNCSTWSSTDVGRPLRRHQAEPQTTSPTWSRSWRRCSTRSALAERDVRHKNGRWYSLRLRPYKTVENKIDGVVAMLVDVDAIKPPMPTPKASSRRCVNRCWCWTKTCACRPLAVRSTRPCLHARGNGKPATVRARPRSVGQPRPAPTPGRRPDP